MSKWYKTAAFLAVLMILSVSCREMFTTSVGTSFARGSPSIPANTSIADLIALSQTSEGSSPEAAKEILDVLGGKTPADIVALSPEDKSAILNLATSAAIDMATLSTLAQSAAAGTAGDSGIETALSAFDTSVNLAAVEVLLADPATRASAPIDSIVLASAVVIADIASEIGTAAIMDILSTGDTTSITDPVLLARVESILDVKTALDLRSDADKASVQISDFNLLDFLNGTEVTP